MRVRILLPLSLALALLVPLVAAPASLAQSTDHLQVLDVTFPTRPDAGLADTYDACRDGCARVHKAADLMGEKGWPLYAMADGVVCRIDEGDEDSYGRHLTLCGDDDRQYRYLHLNNDTPGTDDGAADLRHVYAPGMRDGLRVARGQLLAFMGDSGNAEGTQAHLHLDIFDDRVVDPYGDNRINPYPSLVAALTRGDVPDGSILYSDPVERVAGEDRVGTAIALARSLPVQSDTVVVARADDPTDALVAGPLAGALGAPVLISPPEHLDPRVLDEVHRREATRAVVVGVAPSNAFVAALAEAGLEVQRLAGSDRFGTAEVVAQAVWEATGAGGGHVVDDGDGHAEGEPVTDEGRGFGPVLAVHAHAGRSGTVALDGAEVAGSVAVELLAGTVEDITRVTFTLDGELMGEEGSAPWDLLGTRRRSGEPNLLDTRALDNGEHVVGATVEMAGLPALQVQARFTVANGTGRRALLALGENPEPSRQWPDALMGSWLGAATGQPVLLTGPERLPDATAALLDELTDVTVIGGPVAIADEMLDGLTVPLERLAGADRYATAVAVAEVMVGTGHAVTERAWAATGTNWPDAVTAGPVVAAIGDVLVLVDGMASGGSTATSTWLADHSPRLASGRVIGGPAAVVEGARIVFGLDLT